MRERRLNLGLNKKQLAKHLSVDETTIHNWEDKGVTPAIRLMPRIIEFLGYYPNDGNVVLSIADKLKAQRTKLGLSRRRLAALVGIDQSTLAGWERGDHRPAARSFGLIEGFLTSDQSQMSNQITADLSSLSCSLRIGSNTGRRE